MDFRARAVERIDNPRRASLEPSIVLDHQLKRNKVRINQVLEIPSGPVGSQNKTCQAKSLFQVQMSR